MKSRRGLHRPKPTVVISVLGGVADIASAPSDTDVDIIDLDNLQEISAEEFRRDSLTAAGQKWLKAEWPDLYTRLYELEDRLPGAEAFFTFEDWQYDAANGDTRLGYEQWVRHQVESNPDWKQDFENWKREQEEHIRKHK